MSIVSVSGRLVKSASTSKEPIINEGSCSKTSLLNEKELIIVYGPTTILFKIGTRNLDKPYPAVPIAERIGLTFGRPWTNGL